MRSEVNKRAWLILLVAMAIEYLAYGLKIALIAGVTAVLVLLFS